MTNEIVKTHTWKTLSGKTVTAQCTLTLSREINADGHKVTVDCCDKEFEISVEGYGLVGSYIDRTPRVVNGVSYAANCGSLVISSDNLASIDAMVLDIESHPAWIAKQNKIKKNLKEVDEYEAHKARVEKMMSY